MRYPLENVLRSRTVRRILVPFTAVLAVVFISLMSAAASAAV